jgi:hypothetical protein
MVGRGERERSIETRQFDTSSHSLGYDIDVYPYDTLMQMAFFWC